LNWIETPRWIQTDIYFNIFNYFISSTKHFAWDRVSCIKMTNNPKSEMRIP